MPIQFACNDFTKKCSKIKRADSSNIPHAIHSKYLKQFGDKERTIWRQGKDCLETGKGLSGEKDRTVLRQG